MDFLLKVAITTGIGLLIGLEREYSSQGRQASFAGARTFPLFALLGFLAMYLTQLFSVWVFVIAFAGAIAFVLSSYIVMARKEIYGATTEVTVIITFITGALVQLDQYAAAVSVGVVVTLLLSLKWQFKELVGNISHQDIFALLKFLIMLAIVLPVLPDAFFGPFSVLNPRHIWYMVVLISGVSFFGYILVKTVGSEKGILLTSALGGMASSTAIAWDYAHKSKQQEEYSRNYTIGILLASTIMFPRVFGIVYFLNQALAISLILPIGILTLSGVIIVLILIKYKPLDSMTTEVEIKNPLNLSDAAKFALIFSAVLLLVKVGEMYLGAQGVYIVSAFSGLMELDAITISMTKFSTDSATGFIAGNAIISAMLTNTLFKAALCFFIGNKSMQKITIIGFGALASVGIIYLLITNLLLPHL